MPRGTGGIVRRVAKGPVTELDVEDVVMVDGVRVRAVHAEHDGRRSDGWTPERTAGPALGFVISANRRVYFAGDTDLFPAMADLDPELDLALVPIGGWGLSLPKGHLGPVRAAEAVRRLAAHRAVPIHWGTLRIPVLWRARPELFTTPGSRFAEQVRLVAPETEALVATPGQVIELT